MPVGKDRHGKLLEQVEYFFYECVSFGGIIHTFSGGCEEDQMIECPFAKVSQDRCWILRCTKCELMMPGCDG